MWLCGIVWTADGPIVEVEGRHMHGLRIASACARPSEMGPWRPRAKSRVPAGRLWYTLFTWEAVVRVAQVTMPGQSSRRKQDRRSESVLQVHGQGAPLVVVFGGIV